MAVVLAGDIGGTNTRLAFFQVDEGEALESVEKLPQRDPLQVRARLHELKAGTFPSRDHAGLEEIVARFVADHGVQADRACFGIAGPVLHGRSQATNLPWVVDAGSLAGTLGIDRVRVINDLEASAWGIPALGPDDLVTLQPGAADASGDAVVVAAGTGLGVAGLYWHAAHHHPFATEGGHMDFAPRNPTEDALLLHLRGRFGRVSVERALSGPGIHNIYLFLRDTRRGAEEPWLADELAHGDPPAMITRAALAGKSPLCELTLSMFLSIYGAAAGNLALTLMATGGVYLGGGIAPRLVDRLIGPEFLAAFLDKGRMRSLLERMPVRVIRNGRTALLGAARAALAGGESM